MMDMTPTIVPKSDQLNADDLLCGPITVKITNVSIRHGTEQPISVFYDGDNKKPWKPCKSMARVMVVAWGADASKYKGRSLTLYCDPKVKWGGMEVGGIRISHMSDIDSTLTMALTVTRANKKPFTVKPIASDTSNTPTGDRASREKDGSHLPNIPAARSESSQSAAAQESSGVRSRVKTSNGTDSCPPSLSAPAPAADPTTDPAHPVAESPALSLAAAQWSAGLSADQIIDITDKLTGVMRGKERILRSRAKKLGREFASLEEVPASEYKPMLDWIEAVKAKEKL